MVSADGTAPALQGHGSNLSGGSINGGTPFIFTYGWFTRESAMEIHHL